MEVVSMNTVLMAVTVLLASTATTSIPLESRSRLEESLLEKLSAILLGSPSSSTYQRTNQTVRSLEEGQMSNEKAAHHVVQEHPVGERVLTSDESKDDIPHVENIFADVEQTQVPRRIRRTSHCRRQTDDELMALLQKLGHVDTRYADKTHHGFTSLVSFSSDEKLNRLSKLEIEAALRANQSSEGYLSLSHLRTIRSRLVTPEEAGVPRFRRTVGQTTTNFCVASRQETTRGYMRMCGSCAATTELSADRFPRYLNEVICSSNTACLSGGGQCHERTINVKILRRTEHCSVAASTSSSGQVMYVEDWEPMNQLTRVACECDVNVHSVFAQFV